MAEFSTSLWHQVIATVAHHLKSPLKRVVNRNMANFLVSGQPYIDFITKITTLQLHISKFEVSATTLRAL